MATTELVNPFSQGLRTPRATAPCQLIIFGASGDLTNRKLLPAIYNLAQSDLLPPSFNMVGFARNPMKEDDFRSCLRKAVATSGDVRVRDDAVLEELAARTNYVPGDFHDPAAYDRLKTALDDYDARFKTGGNRIFYIATPASLFADIVERLHGAGLTNPDAADRFMRIVVEKPFG